MGAVSASRAQRRRRPRGSGGVRKAPDGAYEIYYRPHKGAKQIFERVGKDEEAAWRTLDERNAQRHRLSVVAIQGVPFAVVAIDWLESKRGTVRDSTFMTYEHSVNYHLVPASGEDAIGSITARAWRQWQAGKMNGNPDIPVGDDEEDVIPRTLGAWAVKRHMRIARAIYKMALADKFIEENVLDLVEPIRVPPPDIRPLTKEQGRLLLRQMVLEDRALTAVMLHLGLRRGEAFALRWADYDASTRTLSVERTMTRRAAGGYTTGAVKTRAARRTLRVSAGLHNLLMAHKSATADVRNPKRLMFPSSTGTHRQFSQYRGRVFVPAVTEMHLKSLAPDQLDELLLHIPQDLHTVVKLIALPELAGLRLTGLLQARWREYDIDTRTLTFTDTDGNRRREVLPQELHDEVLAARRATGADWLFPGKRHIYLKARPVYEAIYAAAAEVELWQRTRIHDLRHTYASMCIANNVNAKLLARRLGHTNPGFTLAFYGHLYDAQTDAEADTFEM